MKMIEIKVHPTCISTKHFVSIELDQAIVNGHLTFEEIEELEDELSNAMLVLYRYRKEYQKNE